jgi:hypothetical protein
MPTDIDPGIHDLPSRPPPPDLEWLDEFLCEGLIVAVLARLKSGKEATVFVCRGGVASHAGLVAAKWFRPRLGRGFQNRAIYQRGRIMGGASRSYSGVHSIFVRSRAPSMIRTTCTPSSTNR